MEKKLLRRNDPERLRPYRQHALEMFRSDPTISAGDIRVSITKRFGADVKYRTAQDWLVKIRQGKFEVTPPTSDKVIDIDQAIEQWTAIIGLARQAKQLQVGNSQLKNKLAACLNELEMVKADLQKRIDQGLKFRQAQHEGLVGKIT